MVEVHRLTRNVCGRSLMRLWRSWQSLAAAFCRWTSANAFGSPIDPWQLSLAIACAFSLCSSDSATRSLREFACFHTSIEPPPRTDSNSILCAAPPQVNATCVRGSTAPSKAQQRVLRPAPDIKAPGHSTAHHILERKASSCSAVLCVNLTICFLVDCRKSRMVCTQNTVPVASHMGDANGQAHA